MGALICPICNSELSSKNSNNTLSCINKHSFDYAKEISLKETCDSVIEVMNRLEL